MYRIALKGMLCLALAGLQFTACARRVFPPPSGAQEGIRSWRAEFPRPWRPPAEIASAGAYTVGPVVVNFDSLSPLLIEPSPSGTWNVLTGPRRGTVVFRDEKPGLVPNPDPGGQPFYKRAEGAISAMAWVDQEFSDVRTSVRVNMTGGPDGRGSLSRQGPMVRWDKGSNWLWCAVNCAGGTVSIVRAQHFGIMKDIEGSERTIQDFANTKAYDVIFDAVGESLRCQVFEGRKLVADTGTVTDSAPLIRGVSGVLIELSLQKSFEPLEGSFDRLITRELRRR